MKATERLRQMPDALFNELSSAVKVEAERRTILACSHRWRAWSWHGKEDYVTCEWCKVDQSNLAALSGTGGVGK